MKHLGGLFCNHFFYCPLNSVLLRSLCNIVLLYSVEQFGLHEVTVKHHWEFLYKTVSFCLIKGNYTKHQFNFLLHCFKGNYTKSCVCILSADIWNTLLSFVISHCLIPRWRKLNKSWGRAGKGGQFGAKPRNTHKEDIQQSSFLGSSRFCIERVRWASLVGALIQVSTLYFRRGRKKQTSVGS